MSFKKTVLSTIAAAAVATSAFAGTATLSMDGKGDYLNFPAYYATSDGWSTNFRVVNTNTTNAVVAKVVVRDFAGSNELLDFPIYLSPGDVFTFDLVNDAAGNVHAKSTDDSSPVAPAAMDQKLVKTSLIATPGSTDAKVEARISHGYVEVISLVEKSAALIDPTWTEFSPLSKQLIKDNYIAEVTASSRGTWIEPTDSVFGQQVVVDASTGAEKSMTLMAAAQKVTLDSGEFSTNSLHKAAAFATDTKNIAILGSATAQSIRDNFNKSNVHVVNYTDAVGETQVLLTQAMKKELVDPVTPRPTPYVATLATETTYGTVSRFYHMGRAWNESEITPTIIGSEFSGDLIITTATKCDTEICYLYTSDNDNYTSGWVNYILGTDANGVGNENVSTIATTMTGVKVNDRGIVNMLPSAYTTNP
jgi:hypothetical protein